MFYWIYDLPARRVWRPPITGKERMQRRQTNEAIYNCTLIILALVAIVHVLRVFLGWSVTVNGSDIPMWVSVIAFFVAAGPAVGLWRETRV
jgi:hypothetical protein